MWRPGFPFVERVHATITGWHRAFCIASTHYRGTRERPGLVLGLDRGKACSGIAYRVAAADAPRVVAYLRERELIYGVYRETHLPATLEPGASVHEASVLAYIAERRHPSYAGNLPLEAKAAIIRGARGSAGTNIDYLVNTVHHLRTMGLREHELERLAARTAGFALNTGSADTHARPSARGLTNSWRRLPAPTHPIPLGDQRRFGHRVRIADAW
ncbi:MAG: gamma-glutamylcyclotransferase [Proteobacteria bacterium]|nr:gamma-glutamylcyclotransferase [Pseudomonadota bacterium]